jgi:cyclic beta-1,2-glucan synthetase
MEKPAMALNATTIRTKIARLCARPAPTNSLYGDESPLRAELLSAAQMEQNGRIIARAHLLAPKPHHDRLLGRLEENEHVLLDVHRVLTEDVRADLRITPAGEWLLDNFYLIEEQIRTARRHLPKSYNRELPHLINGPGGGFPRVYAIALEIISHGDGRVDPENLLSFVAAYQSVTTLKLGELWAIPIMLRLALIENLRRVAARIAAERITRNLADHWADQMLKIAADDPKSLILTIADMARSTPPMKSSFVAELARRLQGQGPALALPLTWIEQRLSENAMTIEQLVRLENQQQAADQVSVSNSIGSLRFLGAMDWRTFVETLSIVHQTLAEDPGGIYAAMDFATRDNYRHAVERIAACSAHAECEVARSAIHMAREADARTDADDPAGHVGFYLIGDGLRQLEQSVKARFTAAETIRMVCRRIPLLLYGGTIVLMTLIAAGFLTARAHTHGIQGWGLGLLCVLLVICAAHPAIALVNWLATLLVRPHMLPRMDFSSGIPRDLKTLVVVPTMITTPQNIENLVRDMEVRFLANRDANLYFGLLTDFCDAPQQTLPQDAELLDLARERIVSLNEKYSGNDSAPFFLLHRPRRWNPQERLWMGYERKRGKLADLNMLLRGKARERFMCIVGESAVLPDMKYVITLDTDTQLARDSARRFVGTMAHPLNRPRFDKDRQRVVAGYGILQPRVAASLSGTSRSQYARMCASELGIDPYTRAVSDVYQDVFGEGSFIGKGIYDVDAFELALGGRLPENRILSHDLLEGCYARAGLLSDVQLYEEYPFRYNADVSRRHRWIRGDWQIAHWVLPFVPGPDGRLRRNPLSMLSRWKILDNLRRSLTAAALTLLLLLGWTLLPSAWFWTVVVLGFISIPCLLCLGLNAVRKSSDTASGRHIAATMRQACRRAAEEAFALACLPYEAFFSLDAIVRTAWRMLVSRRLLLQWNPGPAHDRTGVGGSYRIMWVAPLTACAAAFGALQAQALSAAGPILALWLFAPGIAWWISRPLAEREARLSEDQLIFLRTVARKTWAFFETFVGPDDHWLPPDNFQDHPAPVIAHRTSPTNMGLALLANLSACDFGYHSAGKLLERTAAAFHTMETLERHQGHFYNWYDTQTLQPLLPRYISSVDSGNLAGHLLTLRSGLLGLVDTPVLNARFFEGLSDTLRIFCETAASATPEPFTPEQLVQLTQDVASATQQPPTTLTAAWICLQHLSTSASQADSDAQAFAADPQSPLRWWARAFAGQCRDALDELSMLAPWAELLSSRYCPDDMPDLFMIPTLRGLETLEEKLRPAIARIISATATPGENAWFAELQQRLRAAGRQAEERRTLIHELAMHSERLARMDYGFLYDTRRHLLAIGYNVGDCRRDPGYYDLLASEARFASFVAIAQGQLPQESWFSLGRLLTSAGGEPILLSWSGSMFEYLMPLLVMPTYRHTLLDHSCRAAVARQIEYGKKRAVPWGISECGYNAIDVHRTYQYRAFGVPGLGLKRGLTDDLVIAPYATALALMVAPEQACLNLERLALEGSDARYGFYEAIDYTPSRLPRGQTCAVVRSFMAHHQGMTLVSLAHVLLDRPMQQRFAANPLFQATMLLLQEKVPEETAAYAHTSEIAEHHMDFSATEAPFRVFTSPDTPSPEVQLLSNGRYHVMVSCAGGGYSRWNDIALTRWREDCTCDNWGTFCYIRDVSTAKFWSTAYQPTLRQAEKYEAIFSEGRAEFRVRSSDYEVHTEIAVSPEDDIELRRIRITNRAPKQRTIEVTSYAEVVLAPQITDELHPAFSSLFVQTEILDRHHALLCTRRPRSQSEQTPWMLHMLTVHGAQAGEVSYETDRMHFIGHGNSVVDPQALSSSTGTGPLSGTQGSVLDPIVAIRQRITLEPEQSVTVNMVSGIGASRDAALRLAEKYQDRRLAGRVFDLAWTHGQVLLRQFNASEADAQLYGRLAGSILYASASLRADQSVLIKNRRGQSGLWGYAISGDLPIVLLQIEDPANIELVRQLVQAHAYWRLKGLAVDLVIWNEDRAGYRQLLHDQIMGLITADIGTNVTDRPGGIFVRPGDQIAEEDRILIQTVARVIISDRRGTLADQINGRSSLKNTVPLLVPSRALREAPLPAAPLPRTDLTFFNGLGGFTPDGREYVITTAREQRTPAPWANVLANPHFGTVLSESGAACTWSENAREFRLTPWGNDPVSDAGGEALYLRDEERGCVWSPTPLPCCGATPYVTRHGFGYSVFEHTEYGIRSELWVYVALDAAVKFSVLKLRNVSDRTRRLSVFGYAEWVMGGLRPKSAMHVITELDPQSGALFARNPYTPEFGDRVAFFDVDDNARTVTGSRTEFLGRNGSLRAPAATQRMRLSGRLGAGLDPCAAMQVRFDLAPGQEHEVIFRLGAGRDAGDARTLVTRFRGSTAARACLDIIWQHWARTLGAIYVETPDQSLNVLANGWLVYQTLACRLWARSATYQSGGAFGFRDQLQDVMALIHTQPQRVREHLLVCAGRQFPEGDVQHWWHPPAGQGVRTHCSDDYLWLPHVASYYVSTTGDTGILDESVHFIQGRAVSANEDSCYDLPVRSEEAASLYEHCVRAVQKSLVFGEHGLPLIGSGDWNDGMNLVGEQGKGESVWLGFFLYDVLLRFSTLSRAHGDEAFAERCISEAADLQRNLEQHGWDGAWYRRAYFDDGSPLGSLTCMECKIDSIAQSWSVLSGAAAPERSRMAMQALDERLVQREHALIQLLDPPFDSSHLNPGYIKGYVPGVRENGGQYTHAAIWAIMAFVSLGDSQRAWELFTMINPVNHTQTPEQNAVYKTEPYVMAADVYAAPQHVGRGGWTWYTGSAGWMYRLIIESFLGLRLEEDRLHCTPCIPADWDGFTVHYRFQETVYHIEVRQTHEGAGTACVTVDGVEQRDGTIPLVNDRREHAVVVQLPEALPVPAEEQPPA